MAKRLREEEHSSKVVTEDQRATKRHAVAGHSSLPENLAQTVPAGWDAIAVAHAAVKQLLVPPGLAQGEPLRPANQAAPDDAAATYLTHHHHQQQQQISPQNSQEQAPQHPALQHDAASAQARAAAAELRCQVDIDWRSPEQVAQLLRMLHMERLRRQGLQLPAEYQQLSQQQQQQQQR